MTGDNVMLDLVPVFDAPAAFSVSLNDPKTARLSWKIPAQMRQPQLRFWFLVEHRTRGNMSKQGDLPHQNKMVKSLCQSGAKRVVI